jgi:Domain of unknown function (DUF4262)
MRPLAYVRLSSLTFPLAGSVRLVSLTYERGCSHKMNRMVRTLTDPGLDDSDRKLLGDVAEFGWHVVLIPDEGDAPGWAFSVGLFHSYKHPEIVVFGLPLELAHRVINGIGEDIKAGNAFEDGHEYGDILEAVNCMLRTVDANWYRPFLGYAMWYYRGGEFPVLQCIWPDKEQRYPWQPGFKKAWLGKQPLLFETTMTEARAVELLRSTGDWKFADPPNVITFTTKQIVHAGEPILLVTHDAGESAWQFLPDGPVHIADAMIVALEQMVKRDPSLAELADLPVGWQPTRSAVGEPWQRTPKDGAKERTARKPRRLP